jgi:hypothetical protein
MREEHILELITLQIKQGLIRVVNRLQINSGAFQTTKCAFHDPSLTWTSRFYLFRIV